MPVTYLWFLFDWRGRIDRRSYRLALLVLVLVHKLFGVIPDRLPALALGLLAGKLVISTALDAKRLHDTGASAIWILLTDLLAAAGVLALEQSGSVSDGLLSSIFEQVLMLDGAALPVPAWLLSGFVLGSVLRGPWLAWAASSPGANGYDFDPRARLNAAPEAEEAFNADRLIARALAKQQAPATPQGPSGGLRPAGPARRASFGRRGLS